MASDEREMSCSPHILIIGAGITGLLIAQGLKKVDLRLPSEDFGCGS